MSGMNNEFRTKLQAVAGSAGDAAIRQIMSEFMNPKPDVQQTESEPSGEVQNLLAPDGVLARWLGTAKSKSNPVPADAIPGLADLAGLLLGTAKEHPIPEATSANDGMDWVVQRLAHYRVAFTQPAATLNLSPKTKTPDPDEPSGVIRDALSVAVLLGLSGAVVYYLMMEESNRRELKQFGNRLIEGGMAVSEEISEMLSADRNNR